MFGLFGNNKEKSSCDLQFLCWCEMSTLGGCGSHGESKGVCGKTSTKVRLQDLLTYGLRGLSAYSRHCG